MKIRILELVYYDPDSETFPSPIYSSLAGVQIPYRYDVRSKDVTITTNSAGGAKMAGKIS